MDINFEDIKVTYKQIATPKINLKTKLITLPVWCKNDNDLRLLFITHELAHYLYTPWEKWKNNYNIPPSILGIVEDIRIEKLMAKNYPNSKLIFENGYKKANLINMFSIKNIYKMSFADRVNIDWKIGSFFNVPFYSNIERDIYKKTRKVETFEDVVEYSKNIHMYCTGSYR